MAEGEAEVTLGASRILALFFGVVVMCALFFVLGYRLGKTAPAPASALQQTTPAVALDNRTLAPELAPDCSQNGKGCAAASLAKPARAAAAQAPAGASTAPHLALGRLSPVPEVPRTAISAGYVVQVAAVSKQQDAEALLAALRKKQYPVFITTPPTDKLFHVQVGPFGEQKDAEAARGRLVADGYNAILKK
jgi:cell division septation protein DedD